MKKLKVIVELNHSTELEKVNHDTISMDIGQFKASNPLINSPHFDLDLTFGTAEIPQVININQDISSNYSIPEFETQGDFMVDENHKNSTYIVRGEVAENDLKAFEAEMKKNKDVVGVYADVEIEPQLICGNSPSVGTDTTVETLLCVSKLKSKGMTGSGVYVAIVDTGINSAHLTNRGKNPQVNLAWSWRPATSSITLGSAPVGHGTMCAYDVLIAAPECTLLDVALLSASNSFSGLLSDAIKAYEHLIRFMNRSKRIGENPSLIVNNSWGMFHPSWDFPVGHSGNFSHNPNHPFNLIVKRLSQLGADILFAAGNCGSECPDGRCGGVTNIGIYGANSSPYVTTVAGIGTNNDRVGYSNRGPGLLSNKKPDITGYTHFRGSGVYGSDSGTSAACPVVAGIFAAVRTVRPYNSGNSNTSPESIRNLITSTATDIGNSGWDYTYGFGLVNGCKIVDKLFPIQFLPKNFCQRYLKICEGIRINRPQIVDLCKRYPKICQMKEIRDILNPKGIRIPIVSNESISDENITQNFDFEGILDIIEISLGGYIIDDDSLEAIAMPTTQHDKNDCGCGCGCSE